MASVPGVRLKRALIFVHRWLGVALCLIFLLWFPSGLVMMYWDFPSISPGDRAGTRACPRWIEGAPVAERRVPKHSAWRSRRRKSLF